MIEEALRTGIWRAWPLFVLMFMAMAVVAFLTFYRGPRRKLPITYPYARRTACSVKQKPASLRRSAKQFLSSTYSAKSIWRMSLPCSAACREANGRLPEIASNHATWILS